MTLSRCLRRAGESIAREDKVAILAKAKELRESGLENQAAARKAVSEILGAAKSTLADMGEKLGLNKPAKPAFSRKEDKPFYSALARGIEGINAKSQPAEGWRAQIQGLVNKGAVKADEVEWSGLNDWLKLREGKVSKQEVQDFIAANGVQVHEVTKGAGLRLEDVRSQYVQAMVRQGATPSEADQMFREMKAFSEDAHSYDEALKDKGYELIMRDGSVSGNELHDAVGDGDGNDSKYGQYVLPGGTNYREMLLTLPESGAKERMAFWDAQRAHTDALADWKHASELHGHGSEQEKAARAGMMAAARQFDEAKTASDKAPQPYKSSHWDEQNVLAHIRLNDRTDASGAKTLFVEELQSDFAQDARKKGFVGHYKPEDVRPLAEGDPESNDPEHFWQFRTPDNVFRIAKSKFSSEAAAHDYIVREKPTNSGGVPRAPFVDSTDKWLPLALKRVMKLAADGGYDKVAFVNGEQSADRYSLAKQVRSVEWTGRGNDTEKNVTITPKDGNDIEFKVQPDGRVGGVSGRAIGNEFDGKRLDDIVGKEMAERIMGAPYGDVRGDGLKVGGAGMRAFYDSVVPQALSKLLPKFGGGKLEPVTLGGTPRFTVEETPHGYEVHKDGKSYSDDWAGALKDTRAAAEKIAREMNASESSAGLSQPGFSVTPAMREKTAGGVPMFSRKDKPEEPAKPTPNPSHGFHTREIQVDGKWRPIEDSSGRLLARGDFRGQQNLWRWFSDSKVTDDRGRPLLMFHGTGEDFSQFHPDQRGTIHFTSDPAFASKFATERIPDYEGEELPADASGSPNVMPVYLKARRLFDPENESHREDLGGVVNLRGDWETLEHYAPKIKALGFDGILVDGMRDVAVFDPTQVKSAMGGVGTFDPKNPDIRFARKGQDATVEPGDDKGNAEGTKLPIRLPATDVLNKARGLVMLVAPMSAGEQTGQAASQQFINNVRAARMGWDRVDGILRKEFTPAERKEMMLAGEDENRRILEGENSTAKGLSVLSKKQRDHMYALHDWSTELWDRAKQAGMVEGDGVPFWTPRMAVLMVDGLAEKLPEGGGRKMAGDIVGGNLSTTAPSMKQRKHPFLRESEEALKAKFGEDAKYVDDVLAMPHAMQKFENAIIGREFVNRIKEIGLATGEELIATNKAHDPNYFTLPHPSLVNAKPKFVTDAETGKRVPAVDQNGDMIFESDPLYIKKEWEGPLKAVLSTKTNAVYTGYMLLKSKAMTAIMYSPLIHQQVIFGRALAYSDVASGGPFKTVGLYFTGHAAKKDDAFMRKMVEAGLVPIGDRHNMLDVSDIANGDIKKTGGWLDPDESWISLSAQKAGNAVKAGMGDKIKGGLDAAGDFWHNSLLWRRIGDLQAGIAKDAYEKLTAKGFSDKVAAIAAAHLGNRYAGSIGSENMSKLARGAGNVALFSLSFNAANVGTVKDAAFGTTAGLNALIKEKASSPMEAAQIQQFLKNKARWGLVKDYAYFLIGMNLANLWFKRDKDAEWDFKGSVDRGLEQELKIAQRTWAHMTLHPTDVETYLSAMTGSQDNEPGKENRVHMGNQEGGRSMYMRLPTGKVVEDLVGWFSDPAKLASAKQSPFLRAVIKGFENERDQYGSPIRDPKDPFYKRVADTAKFVLSTHFPTDQVQTLLDIKNGVGTPLDKEKIQGNLTGLTISQGHPMGPEAGVAAKVEEANKQSVLHAMPQVRHYLKYGMEDEARALLEEKTTLTPKEINKIIRKVDEPRGQMSPTQRRNFQRHSQDADQDRMENVTR